MAVVKVPGGLLVGIVEPPKKETPPAEEKPAKKGTKSN